MLFTTTAFAALMGMASAQMVHVVSVGAIGGGSIFSPDSITAATGDMIQFQFRSGEHSVVQSNFDNPCTPLAQHTNMTGWFSGFQDVAASEAMGMIPTYTVMVQNEMPMWLYCSKAKHCQNGMVMVVNENPTANSTRTLDNFKQLASAAPDNVSPEGAATGGTAGTDDADSAAGTGADAGAGADAAGAEAGADSADASADNAAATASGAMVAISSTMGLLSVAAALFML